MKTLHNLKKTHIFLGIVIVGFVLTNIWMYNGRNSILEAETQNIENITPKDAHKLIQEHEANENFVILDVRTPAEFAQGHIANAINIDFYSATFKDKLKMLDKEKTYFIYCRSGNRSGRTLNVLSELQFKTAYNMLGGILQWGAEGRPITKQ